MWRIVVLITLVLAVTMQSQAGSKKTDKNIASQEGVKGQLNAERREVFTPAERNLIRAQLIGQKRTTPLQRDMNLPLGLQQKVARGKALPPGWQKRVVQGHSLDYHVYRQGNSLPDGLLQRLPPPPVGSEILQIEDKIVRLNSATRTILDVFDLRPAH
jgi:hypothetical protein